MAEKKASLLIELKDKVSNALGTIGGRLDKFADQLDKSKLLFAGVAAASAFLGKQFISAADKMEQWTISFTTMLGSAGRAKAMMQELTDFAAKTPFELPDVIKGAKSLLAYGIEAQNIIPTLKSLGDVSAGLSVPIERLILNYGQIKTQAQLTGRELRDFAVAGVPLLATLAEQMNKSESEISEMVSAGKIGFPDVEAAFKSMSGEGGRFANLMEKQMTTVSGVVSNVKDAFFRLSADLGAYLLPIAKSVAYKLINLFEWINNLTPQTKFLAIAVGGLVGGLSALFAVMGGIATLLPVLIAGFGVLTSPITLAIGAIGLITAAIIGLHTNALGMYNIVTTIFTALGNAINLIAQAIKAALTLHFGEAKTYLAQAAEEIKNGTTTAWETLKTNVGNTIDEIVAKVKGGSDQIVDIKKLEAEALAKFAAEQKAREERDQKTKEEAHAKARAKELAEMDAFTKLMVTKLEFYGQKSDEINKFYNTKRVDNLRDTLTYIHTLSVSENKTLATIGKASAIAMATIDTYSAVGKALASAPWPFNLALAAGALAAGLSNVDRIRSVGLKEGGIVLPRQGGTLATIGEAGKKEAVIPLESERGRQELGSIFGEPTVVNINAGVLVADDRSIRELAQMIDETLFKLRQNRQTVAF